MNLKHYTLSFLLICLFTLTSQAQIFIDTGYTAEEMVDDFFSNSCVTPSNITYAGAAEGLAFFDAGGTDLGVMAGMFFSTGNVNTAVGPNDTGGTSGSMGEDGDTDLENLLSGFQTFDASVLEMDIVSTGTMLDFSYVFASEEYPEFVNTGFNDIFAFFISGPGITGLQNIAMVPGLPEPVSINTINNLTNTQYYVDNSNGMDISFDGYTTELTASAVVMAGETYHIKIAISDVSDQIFDSGIFLGIQSLCGDPLLVPPAQGSIALSGNTISIENDSKYATSYAWDFGDMTTSTERHPAPHTYAADGIYEVTLITQNYCCSDTLTTIITVGDPVGIDDLEDRPFSFAPNPVDDLAQFIFENGESFDLKIYDATGKLIIQDSNVGTTDFNFGDFSAGIYFFDVKVDGKVYRDKFLKL